MGSYFEHLPIELIIIIYSYLCMQDREFFTKAYPEYYHLFYKQKKKFLSENLALGYRPLDKIGIERALNTNLLCVSTLIRKKRFFVDCFPKPLRDFFINYDTPMLNEKNIDAYMFDDSAEKLENSIYIGQTSKELKFILMKTKNNKFIKIWEQTKYGKWKCMVEGIVIDLISKYYVNFFMLNIIINNI